MVRTLREFTRIWMVPTIMDFTHTKGSTINLLHAWMDHIKLNTPHVSKLWAFKVSNGPDHFVIATPSWEVMVHYGLHVNKFPIWGLFILLRAHPSILLWPLSIWIISTPLFLWNYIHPPLRPCYLVIVKSTLRGAWDHTQTRELEQPLLIIIIEVMWDKRSTRASLREPTS